MSRLRSWLPVAVILTVPPAGAETTGALSIEHQQVPCAVAGRHPRVEARVAGDASALLVYFHGEDAPDWYAVAMRRQGEVWTADLPRPERVGTRFAYFISALAPANARGRLPEASAFLVDVAEACPEGGLPTSPEGPAELRVPPGAPRVPAGFSRQGIGSYVEYMAGERPRPATTSTLTLLPPRSHVRITTLEPIRRLEGELESQDENGVALRMSGKVVRLRNDELARLEVRQPGSTAMGAVGALAGATAGFVGAALLCISMEDLCQSAGPLWVGTGIGLTVGTVAGSAPEWRSGTLLRRGAFSLDLQRRRASAALSVRARF